MESNGWIVLITKDTNWGLRIYVPSTIISFERTLNSTWRQELYHLHKPQLLEFPFEGSFRKLYLFRSLVDLFLPQSCWCADHCNCIKVVLCSSEERKWWGALCLLFVQSPIDGTTTTSHKRSMLSQIWFCTTFRIFKRRRMEQLYINLLKWVFIIALFEVKQFRMEFVSSPCFFKNLSSASKILPHNFTTVSNRSIQFTFGLRFIQTKEVL